MDPDLTNTLCTGCGLCCDGSLFADVELTGSREAAGLEVMGLEIEEAAAGGELLLQPCRALQGKRCSIYAHRPECCRTFECRLLQDVPCGRVDTTQAQARIAEVSKQIARVRELSAELGQSNGRLPLKELCMEALTSDAQAISAWNRKRARLECLIASVEESIQQRFLGDPSLESRGTAD